MPISAKTIRIGGAVLIAIFLVVAGYVLPGMNFPETKPVNAELTDDLLANYIAKDSDEDGLPDWQETLYGTDSRTADTDGDGITDGEAVRRGLLTPTALSAQLPEDPVGEDEPLPGKAPAKGSLTEEFARTFFETVMRESGGQPMSEEDQHALTQRLLGDFSQRAASKLASSYSMLSIRVSADASLTSYADEIVRILNANEVPEGSQDPILLIQAYLEKDDPAAQATLVAFARSYRAIADQLLLVPVPQALADEHLALARSFDSLAKATDIAAHYEDDPLGLMGSLTVYGPVSRDAVAAFQGIATEIVSRGEPAPGTASAFLVNLARYSEQL